MDGAVQEGILWNRQTLIIIRGWDAQRRAGHINAQVQRAREEMMQVCRDADANGDLKATATQSGPNVQQFLYAHYSSDERQMVMIVICDYMIVGVCGCLGPNGGEVGRKVDG